MICQHCRGKSVIISQSLTSSLILYWVLYLLNQRRYFCRHTLPWASMGIRRAPCGYPAWAGWSCGAELCSVHLRRYSSAKFLPCFKQELRLIILLALSFQDKPVQCYASLMIHSQWCWSLADSILSLPKCMEEHQQGPSSASCISFLANTNVTVTLTRAQKWNEPWKC